MRRIVMVAAVLVLVLGVGSLGPAQAQLPLQSPVRLTPVGSAAQPVAMGVRPGDSGLYIVEKGGRIVVLRDGVINPLAPVLDISDKVSTGSEQGLLGLAFSPDGARLYVNYTDTAGDTHIAEFVMGDDGLADEASERQVLFVDQPFANHNAGQLAFGPDGYLYIALGDGGGAGDPNGNGQNLAALLGKVLRIDPRASGGAAYTVPADNPFVGVAGARPEIWSYGLRNPWRFSFDRVAGDLWIGDVGQNTWEEIDYQTASSGGGENWGWNRMEGRHPFEGGTEPPDHVPPIHEYPTDQPNCSVIGGYVYRGAAIPDLAGAYVYSDYCGGGLRALRQSGGTLESDVSLEWTVPLTTTFGQDAAGELYVASQTGLILRLDPQPA